ncbi:ribosomal RNA-processing protein 8 [Nilaparvata lugens]|uniref:ribosomal RNA-processing protein 8 n=1 Tax=Nilaparvata lugens TaxID=108931 RepID=UPI00193EB238|nr:ribosomal RNA-processing protein 8 [Nilaparvata lugens]
MGKNKRSNTSKKGDRQSKKFKVGSKSHNIAKRNVSKTEHVNSKHNVDNSSTKSRKRKIDKNLSLRERMMEKLKSARFRYLNEQLYTAQGKETSGIFKNQELYKFYHEGFRQQVEQWPVNPIDIIIGNLTKKAKSNSLCIADFGCGEAKLAESLESLAEVHSFDLVAVNSRVTKCDMSHTPLQSASVDVAVFCLSLMGTNLSSFIAEANRVLKEGGILKIAEVESRFDNPDHFIAAIERFGFKSISKDYSHKVFFFFDFKKLANISKKRKNKLPEVSLKPCLYKKR